jgi:hypothetical protein
MPRGGNIILELGVGSLEKGVGSRESRWVGISAPLQFGEGKWGSW